MPETRYPLNKPPLPQSYHRRNTDNPDTLRECIRDARQAGCNPASPPVERHLHRIVASAEQESLHHLMSHEGAHAERVERLVNDAIQELENIRLQAAR